MRKLVVKVTCGVEEPERLSQAFTVTATALSSGLGVSVWLTGDSVWLAMPGQAGKFSLPHAPELDAVIADLLAEGQLTACTQCLARRNIGAAQLLPGVRVAGAAAFVEEIMSDGVQALVY